MGTNLHVLFGYDEGRSYELEDFKSYTVGRSIGNNIQIRDRNVSRYHLKISNNGSMFFIKDLDSKNGTFIDGKDTPPGEEVETKLGVPIVIGVTVLGLGEISKSTLQPFFNQAEIFQEICEGNIKINPYGAMVVKKYLEFIYDMDKTFNEAKNIDEIPNKMLDKTFDLLQRIDRCIILLTESNTGEITNILYRSRARMPITDPAQAYNHELVQKSLELNKPIMISDSYNKVDEGAGGDEEITKSLQIMRVRSAMCIPIHSILGTRGAIYVDSITRTDSFRKNDLALLKDISGRAALAMDNIDIHSGTFDNSIN